jgi:hypothetical protein
MEIINLKGKTFGRLTAKKCLRRRDGKTSRVFWFCSCDCGNKVIIRARSLISGNTKSCGCLKMDRLRIHGMTHTKEYRVWWGMLQRCYNEKNTRYYCYGGRGIKVCEEWRDFNVFYQDMGDIPAKGLTIDRIDNDGDYYKKNCRWATRSQQQRNKQSYPKNNRLPKGDSHWTKHNREKAYRIAVCNIRKTHKAGENNANAKMTKKTAKEMVNIYKKSPDITMSELGKIFGVGRETARKVMKGVTCY